MTNGPLKDMNFQSFFASTQATVIKVITDPIGFFRYMQRGGGYVEPLLFMVVMGVISGILQTILNLVGLGSAGAMFALGTSIILVPIMVVIFSFIGAGIMFVIWKLLGSHQSYECAYRCIAYAGAISPITTVLSMIPYIGPLIGIGWMTFLMVAASVEVHEVQPKMAWIVFGILAGVLALGSVSSQLTARKYARELDKWGKEMGKIDQMAPEEAGKKMGEFLKGMQEGMGKKGQSP
jgi:hypothetical protein